MSNSSKSALVLMGMLSLAVSSWGTTQQPYSHKVVAVPYYGLFKDNDFEICGRVLRAYDFPQPAADESVLTKLVRNILRLNSRELENSPVTLEIDDRKMELRTDRDGFVRFRGSLDGPARSSHRWRIVPKTPNASSEWADGYSLSTPRRTVIITDLDDTLIDTKVNDRMGLVARVLFKEATDLKPIKDAALFLQKFHKNGSLIIYLSASPWNLHDQLKNFLTDNAFPDGPLLLRNYGLGEDSDEMTDSGGYKAKRFKDLLPWISDKRLILLGDSGEQDPEVYLNVRSKMPDNPPTILIRKVPDVAFTVPDGVISFDSYSELTALLQNKGILSPVHSP